MFDFEEPVPRSLDVFQRRIEYGCMALTEEDKQWFSAAFGTLLDTKLEGFGVALKEYVDERTHDAENPLIACLL